MKVWVKKRWYNTHDRVYCTIASVHSQGERECNRNSSHTNVNANGFSAFIIAFVGEWVVGE